MMTRCERCGASYDDAVYDTTCHGVEGDVRGHYPIGAGPGGYCKHCDLYRPCLCDKAAEDRFVATPVSDELTGDPVAMAHIVDKVRQLRLAEGDTLVCSLSEHPDIETVERIKAQLAETFAGLHNVTILVVMPGVDFTVITNQENTHGTAE